MAEIETGNLYDMNKVLVEHYQKILTKKEVEEKESNTIIPYFEEKIDNNGEQYYMLLCHEKRDYTVFNAIAAIATEYPNRLAKELSKELKECLLNRGNIYDIDRTSDGIALEIWIKYAETNETICYYLFPYSAGVIEVF